MTDHPVTRAASRTGTLHFSMSAAAAVLLCGVGCQVPSMADACGDHPAEGVVRMGGTSPVVRAQSPAVGTCQSGDCQSETCQSGDCQSGTCQSGTCPSVAGPGGVVGGRRFGGRRFAGPIAGRRFAGGPIDGGYDGEITACPECRGECHPTLGCPTCLGIPGGVAGLHALASRIYAETHRGGVWAPRHTHAYSYRQPRGLTYPPGTQPGRPGATGPLPVVQYPYYTTKGPDDFLHDADGTY